MQELSVAEIAALVGGETRGDARLRIRGVAALESAGSHDLSFVANPRYLAYLQGSRAGAVLVSTDLSDRVPEHLTRVVVAEPHVALYHVLTHFHPTRPPVAGVHPSAVVEPGAVLDAGVSVGPLAVIGAGARLARNCRIGAHVVVGAGSTVGEESVIHPHVTLYPGVEIGARCVVHSGARIGRDGFGFVWVDGGHRKVPQVGGCRLEDDVEVGNNVTIDRGSITDTVVGQGTKLDSLVHLGHNVRVGRHAILVAQVGVSGSTRIGDGAVIGGQVGVAGHISIGAGARVGAQAGVTADVPPGETYSGYPARPHREALRAQGWLFRLPELVKRLRELERAVLGERK
jgi:UDP-3-O-[3-hydroxymyristoyl] glucosamine N-acyltransferase